MTYIIGAIVIVVFLYFFLGKKMGDTYVRQVGVGVARGLRESGQPERAIENYMNSMKFAVQVKSNFARLSQDEAISGALKLYQKTIDEWREK
jgi:hypothetical protein